MCETLSFLSWSFAILEDRGAPTAVGLDCRMRCPPRQLGARQGPATALQVRVDDQDVVAAATGLGAAARNLYLGALRHCVMG